MKTTDFLDAVKQRHGLATDYQLAKFLRMPPGRVSMYRTGKRELDDASCVQIAEALELPAPYVLACIAEQRAKSADVKRYWRDAAKLLKSGTAAALLVAAMVGSQSAPSASRVLTSSVNSTPYTLCALRRRRYVWRPERRRRRVSRRVIVSNDTYPTAA